MVTRLSAWKLEIEAYLAMNILIYFANFTSDRKAEDYHGVWYLSEAALHLE